ncbi:hypothetical protein ACQPZF_34520 [Actinosynnema sp. CS-041913]|uniref:hypothetical protein n=1 Tax=Actinosynnema sp. CS-041913 TaxID=3239917 RepID=UPI003D8DD961
MTDNPFRPTAEERRQGYTLLAELAASMVLGPVAPFAVLAARYLYDRRDAIFDRAGVPVQAFDASGESFRLDRFAAARAPGNARSVVSVRPGLTASARALGLREGDPVGLVLTGQDFRATRSGLVVPARIGEHVALAVPRGTYSLGAFAGRRDHLFATPHPFTAVDGRMVTLNGHGALDLSLATPRPTRRPPFARGPLWPGGPGSSGLALSPPPGGYRLRHCPRCGRLHPVTWQGCAPPAVPAPGPDCWWCGLRQTACDCLIGEARRFWNGN